MILQRASGRLAFCCAHILFQVESSLQNVASCDRLVVAGAITAGGIVCPSSSAAFTTLQDKNGKDFGVYEVAFNLNIVALQSSVTPETILEFQSLYKKYAGLKIGFRNSMQVRAGLTLSPKQ